MPILTDDMKRVVREQGLCFVATVCPDGTPNLSPKGTTAVWDDDRLVYVDLASPRTTANLAANPAVEVNIVDVVTRTGYRFKGRAEVHVAGSLFRDVVAFYQRDRQMDASRVRGVVVIEVESAAALISPAYGLGLSGAEIVDRSLRRLERVYDLRIAPAGDASGA